MSQDPTDRPETEIVPVFPLPGTVLFPHTVLALHIFEPRYRTMIRDARAGDGRIAVALIRDGGQPGREPEFHRIAATGRIANLRALDDGRFLLDLVGLQRVELHEIEVDTPYRQARAVPSAELDVEHEDASTERDRLELLATSRYLMRAISREGGPELFTDDGAGFAQLVNRCCAELPVDAAFRQRLLELGDLRQRHAMVTQLIDEVLEGILRLDATDLEPAPEAGLN